MVLVTEVRQSMDAAYEEAVDKGLKVDARKFKAAKHVLLEMLTPLDKTFKQLREALNNVPDSPPSDIDDDMKDLFFNAYDYFEELDVSLEEFEDGLIELVIDHIHRVLNIKRRPFERVDVSESETDADISDY